MALVCPTCGGDNPDRARFCLSCAEPLETRSSPEERKLASVLFADLVGSTALAHDQDPERTRLALERFYDAMAEEIERCGGTVEKFVGDAVMAAFGAPVAQEDHAERALHAGLAMQRRLRELFDGRLELRVGVNTGEVVVGRPRQGSSFVSGDTVNVAARLEQAAAPGEVLAGERTVTAARGAFEFGEPRELEAKGTAGVPGRSVLRALSLARPRGLRGLPSVFVGRDAELEELQQRFRASAANGEPQLVCILGDAGVGKSRLIRELWGWLAGQSPEPIRRTGRTLSYGQGTTYWPLGEILREHFGLAESDPPETIATRLDDRPYLGMTLGLGADTELHPLVARERLHDAWVSFVGELARDRPVVMLIEDVHWAEEDLFDLVDTLVAQVSGPLLLLVTARPELLDRRPAWGGAWGRVSALRMEPLPTMEAGRLLEALLGDEAPNEIRELVIDRAEGNPFFVEELVGTLIDRGVLARSNGAWRFGPLPPGFTVPDSVQAVLAARIDLLPAAEKAALQAAAVIGRTFWTGPVYELLGGERPDIGVLEERDFVRRRPGSDLAGEREYVIKHALTRDVAYAGLPKARRAHLHAAFADWLESRAEGREELAPLVAHHFAEAVRPEDRDLTWAGDEARAARLQERAVSWLRRAGELAIGRYEIDDALDLLGRAVELEPDPTSRATLWYEIGHARALKYDGQGFVEAMETALELGAPEALVYPELAYQTMQRMGMWRKRLDDELIERWIKRAVRVAADGTPARVRALVAEAAWDASVSTATMALDQADALGDPELRSAALGRLAFELADTGDLDRALEVIEARRQLLPAVRDPDHVAEALGLDVDLAIGMGRMVEAGVTTSRLQTAVAGLTPHHRVHGLRTRVELASAVGDWPALRSLARDAEDEIEANLATPCPFNVGILLVVAEGFAYGGDWSEVGRLTSKAEAIGMVGYDRVYTRKWLRLAVAREDHDEIRRLVDATRSAWLSPTAWELWPAYLDGLAALGDRARIEELAPWWLDRRAYVSAFAARALGVARGDRDLLEDAAARFEAMGLAWHAEETERLLADR